MKTYSLPRNIWRGVYPALIYFVIFTAVSFVSGIIYAILIAAEGGMASPGAVTMKTMENAIFIVLVSNILCLAPFLPIWIRMKKALRKYRLILAGHALFTVILTFIGLNLLIDLIITAADMTRFFPSYDLVEQFISSGNLFIRFLTIVVAAPMIEELCLRGIILNRLLSWLPATAAVLIQAALFGIMHLNLLQGIYAFIIGVAFGCVYLRFRRLWLCVAAHMAFNFAGYLLSVLQEYGVDYPLIALLPGIAISAVSLWYLLRLPVALPADHIIDRTGDAAI